MGDSRGRPEARGNGEGREERVPLDLEALAERLAALANARRLELLAQLAAPSTIADLELRPSRREARGNPDRAMTRTAVEKHLKSLEDAGLVVHHPAAGDQRGRSFTVRREGLFRLIEDLHALAERPSPEAASAGPRFVAVGWLDAGLRYPLGAGREGGWTLGSDERADVALPHDPWLAPRHAAVEARGGTFVLRDLAAGEPVQRNFVPLPRGGEAPLRHGDVVGAGRSLLVFHEV